jgi:hypothetical protein
MIQDRDEVIIALRARIAELEAGVERLKGWLGYSSATAAAEARIAELEAEVARLRANEGRYSDPAILQRAEQAEAKLARVVEAITRSGENGLMTEGEAKRLLALAAVKEKP